MKKFILPLFSLLILLSIFSCKNMFENKNVGELKFGLGTKVAEKISRTLLQSRGITSDTKLDVRCRVRVLGYGNDSIFLEEIKPTPISDLANVSFHLKDLPLNTEFHIQVEILHNEIYLYGGASRPITLTEKERNYKINIPVKKRMSVITYNKNGGNFPVSTKLPTEYFINAPVDKIPVPEKSGYKFEGWFLDSQFTGKPVTSLGPDNFLGDVNLYAKWTEIDSTNFFMIDGSKNICLPEFDELANLYYPGFGRGEIPGTSVTKSKAAPYIVTATNTNPDTTNWPFAYYLVSIQNYKLEANTNYQISLDLKADKPVSTMVQFREPRLAEMANSSILNVTDKWQTFTFESGCWDREMQAHLQVTMNGIPKLYLKNLKVTKLSTKNIPISGWVNSGNHSHFQWKHIPNGAEFTYNEYYSCGRITGFSFDGGKLYELTATVKSDTPNTPLSAYFHSQNDNFEIGVLNKTIGTSPEQIKLYTPANLTGYRFGHLELAMNKPDQSSGELSSPVKITITDISVKEVNPEIPGKSFALYDGDNQSTSLSKNVNPAMVKHETTLQPGASLSIRPLLVNTTGDVIDWNDFTEFRNVITNSPSINIHNFADYDRFKVINNQTDKLVKISITFTNTYDVMVTEIQ